MQFSMESVVLVVTLEHWDDTIIRMWQPYNGFEVFKPGSWIDGIADPSVLAV